jgi:hypothetical protein
VWKSIERGGELGGDRGRGQLLCRQDSMVAVLHDSTAHSPKISSVSPPELSTKDWYQGLGLGGQGVGGRR